MTIVTTPEDRIIAALHPTIVDGEIIGYDSDTPMGELYRRAQDAGAQWKWDAAEEALDAMYALVGAKNEYTGHAWHVGQHPLQVHISTIGA